MRTSKLLVMILIISLLLVTFTACSPSEAPTNDDVSSVKPEKQENDTAENTDELIMPKGEIIIGGAASYTGNYHADGTAIAEALTRSGANSSVILSGGVANIIGVGDGSIFTGPTGATNLIAAYEGTDEAFTRLYPDVVPIMALDIMANYFIVPGGSNIKSISDLKGKTVVTGLVNSSSYLALVDCLKAYGLKPEDLNLRMASMGEGNDMLADRLVDAYFMNTGIPNSNIMELTTSVDVNILPMDEEHVNDILSYNDAYQSCILPAGTYKGQDEDVLMIGFKTLMVANSETPDAEIKWVLKSITDNWDFITKACVWLSDLSFEDLANAGSIPMHKAAESFYNELLK